MEESSGVQAPVTRLRRRLSMEQSEDLNSPGPATPTKKRGGRLAAKPQLELIVENADTTNKRSTKKAAVKELAEASEEKPLTPSRRSTRIKSNTSIVSETTQSTDSPRAKRAARRTSQVGSDNETVVTPARQTRRTRRDSASSIDKLETTLAAKTTNITEIIIEETEINTQKPNGSQTLNNNESPTLRKSPRLKEKKKDDEKGKKTKNDTMESDSITNVNVNDLNIVKQVQNDSYANTSIVTDTAVTKSDEIREKSADTSLDIVKELDERPKNKSSNANKSMSEFEDVNSFKNKRQRTTSLDVVSPSQTRDNFSAFFSDSEKSKKKVKKNSISADLKKSDPHFAAGDSNLNSNESTNSSSPQIKLNTSKHSELNTKQQGSNNSLNNVMDLQNNTSAEENKENKNVDDDPDSVINILKKSPSKVLHSTVLFEDSDTDTKLKVTQKNLDSEDQCVPVVETRESCENSDNVDTFVSNKSDEQIKETNIILDNSIELNKSKENTTKNDSFEPMDVDVTLPNNITVSETSQLNKSDPRNLKLETSHCEIEANVNISSNKSKRKSSISLSSPQNLEKSGTENKSTLILSQIKDVSSSDNNVTKSPKPYQEILSKSTNNNSEITNDKIMDKKNVSLDYSTSTPLQQKHLKKLGLHINSSLIESSKNDSKQSLKSPNDSKKNKELSKSANIDTSSDEESNTDDECSRTKSLFDNEADVASDDYESGDSQDEEQRQYEAENEILEKGETLDSEDELSNDSDYEKDSFVVSSDEEDQNLLSGSGDDLSMSDNELTMSAKSKKKYNERKQKEQKKASKEMFDARHKSDANPNKSDTKKSHKKPCRLDSSDDSQDEIFAPKRTKNHQRLNSTNEDGLSVNESLNKSKAKKRLSESDFNENATNEQEITTVFNTSTAENDPLSSQVKQEPKTPLKDFNMSTVQINEGIEEVVVENDNSISKNNQTSDPLRDSMMDEDTSSSLSANPEITSNYDSILNQLNKELNIKSHDLSLNRPNKTKDKKIPIVEELNLTSTKKSKKKKKTNTIDVVDAPQPSKKERKKEADNTFSFDKESSSDSIDLHLLFSEDSNDNSEKASVVEPTKEKNAGDDFIPLKRTPGKINILNHQDNEGPISNEMNFIIDIQGTGQNRDASFNVSVNNSAKKKNKKNKSLNISQQPSVTEKDNEEPSSNEMKFIIDTQGTGQNRDASFNVSVNNSAKKKNKKNKSLNISQQPSVTEKDKEPSSNEMKFIIDTQSTGQNGDDSFNTSMNNSAKKKKKKNKSLNISQQPSVTEKDNEEPSSNEMKFIVDTQGTGQNEDDSFNTSMNNSAKKKKKKNKSLNISQQLSITEKDDDAPLEVSFQSSKNEKGRTSLNTTKEELGKPVQNIDNLNISSSGSTKKKKKKSIPTEQTDENIIETTIPKLDSAKKSKKTPVSESRIDPIDNEEPTKNEIKFIMDTQSTGQNKNDSFNVSVNNSTRKKNKKNKSLNISQPLSVTEKEEDDAPLEVSYQSSKHEKRRASMNTTKEELKEPTQFGPDISSSGSTKKKKKKSLLTDQTDENIIETTIPMPGSAKKSKNTPVSESQIDSIELNSEVTSNSKKRKRNSSANLAIDNNINTECVNDLDMSQTLNVESAGREKKKRKISQNDDNIQIEDGNQKRKNKKRKRDGDDDNQASKKLKENAPDKVHIARLPASILHQLEDKPKKSVLDMKKANVVSTTPFVVEEAKKRKNKPSNFLEESVYLNDSHDEKKQKGLLKKPKVLPFVPTAITSGSGFTTNFKINIIPKEVQFVAQSMNVTNFKNDYLYGKKLKRFGTYEMYKKHRASKLSKF